MDNATLAAAVRAEMDRMGALPPLEVEMADGIVTLGGEVPDEGLRRQIEQRLLALPEVLDVHNYLEVVPPCDSLETRLLAILGQEGVAVEDLRVAIDNGVVTLLGSAASWFDRDAMARAAWRLPGVRGVVNRVQLPPGAVEPGADESGAPLP